MVFTSNHTERVIKDFLIIKTSNNFPFASILFINNKYLIVILDFKYNQHFFFFYLIDEISRVLVVLFNGRFSLTYHVFAI